MILIRSSIRSKSILQQAFFFLLIPFGLISNSGASTASFHVSGRIPEVLSLRTETLIEDLDLQPGRANNDKLIGKIGLRVNTDIAAIVFSSSTESGVPENMNSEPFEFSKPFRIKVNDDCPVFAKSAFTHGVALKPTGVGLQLLGSSDQSNQSGIDETCKLSATWGSMGLDSTSKTRSQNEYSMNIIVSVVSL